MISAGFLIKSLGPSQQSIQLATEMNALVSQKPDVSMCIFYRDFDKIVATPHFAMFMEYEAWDFPGIAIATNIHSAKTLLRCPGPTRKFFYIWEPEWVFMNKLQYSDMAHVYQNKDMPLIVRSQFHYDIVSQL